MSNYFSGDLGEVTIYPNLFLQPEIRDMFLNYVLEFTQKPGSITAFTLFDSISAVDNTSILVDTPEPADAAPSLPEGLGFSDKITLLVNNQTVPIEKPVVLGNSTNLAENLGLVDKITILLNNQTVNLESITGTASNLTHSEIEIGKMVNWTQTVMLNGTADASSILVELPSDAQNIQVEMDDGSGNYTEITGVLEITESEMKSGENSTENKISFREMAKMLNATEIIPLDLAEMKDVKEIKQKGKPTKGLLIDDSRHKDHDKNEKHTKVKQFNSDVNLVATSNTSIDIQSIVLNNTQNM